MKIIAVKDYHEMSNKAAQFIIEQVKRNPSSVLGMATGSTPKGTYQNLIEDYNNNHTDYKNIQTINLDEYVGLNPENKNSYRYFMNKNLFHEINIQKENTHIPNGMAQNIEAECKRYDNLISRLGIDIQILGIGINGHIGFNEPGTPFQSKTHVVKLTDSTREANARFFDSIDEVPTEAITMGIQSILQSKKIILLASGKSKARAIERLLSGEMDEQFPASSLHHHQNVTVIADLDALTYCQDAGKSYQHT